MRRTQAVAGYKRFPRTITWQQPTQMNPLRALGSRLYGWGATRDICMYERTFDIAPAVWLAKTSTELAALLACSFLFRFHFLVVKPNAELKRIDGSRNARVNISYTIWRLSEISCKTGFVYQFCYPFSTYLLRKLSQLESFVSFVVCLFFACFVFTHLSNRGYRKCYTYAVWSAADIWTKDKCYL